MVVHIDDSDDDDNRVGYCKPPKHTRFKKGQSGNPSGRRSHSAEHEEIKNPVKKVLLRQTTGTLNGKTVKITNAELVVMKLIASAVKGNGRAAKLLLDNCGGADNLFQEPKYVPSEAAKELLRQFQASIDEQVFGQNGDKEGADD